MTSTSAQKETLVLKCLCSKKIRFLYLEIWLYESARHFASSIKTTFKDQTNENSSSACLPTEGPRIVRGPFLSNRHSFCGKNMHSNDREFGRGASENNKQSKCDIFNDCFKCSFAPQNWQFENLFVCGINEAKQSNIRRCKT